MSSSRQCICLLTVHVAIDTADRSYGCGWVRAPERLHASVESVHDVCDVALCALLGRFETRVCSPVLSLVRRRAMQVAAVSVQRLWRACRRAAKVRRGGGGRDALL